ncbi:hypothetical protein RRG08_000090 [Elysia crispata]|uniref:Homeobox domain-containing protein n=1 Tax=Elysia crispata TaxID=231223 RepID=A0AAE1A208_9GAST|nr:hypothetical protein RRG08_000090 [Elysia crispata]
MPGIKKDAVLVWFQNRRAKWRKRERFGQLHTMRAMATAANQGYDMSLGPRHDAYSQIQIQVSGQIGEVAGTAPTLRYRWAVRLQRLQARRLLSEQIQVSGQIGEVADTAPTLRYRYRWAVRLQRLQARRLLSDTGERLDCRGCRHVAYSQIQNPDSSMMWMEMYNHYGNNMWSPMSAIKGYHLSMDAAQSLGSKWPPAVPPMYAGWNDSQLLYSSPSAAPGQLAHPQHHQHHHPSPEAFQGACVGTPTQRHDLYSVPPPGNFHQQCSGAGSIGP